MLLNGVVEGLHGFWVESSPPTPSPRARLPPHSQPYFLLCSSVMSFSGDTLLELSMTLVRLSGAKSLRDPSVCQLLGEWVAHSPWAQARCAEAKDGGYRSFIQHKQIVAVKQYACVLFPRKISSGFS